MVTSGLLNLGAGVWAVLQSHDWKLAAVYTMWGVGNIIMASKG